MIKKVNMTDLVIMYDISQATLSGWKKTINKKMLEEWEKKFTPEQIEAKKKARIMRYTDMQFGATLRVNEIDFKEIERLIKRDMLLNKSESVAIKILTKDNEKLEKELHKLADKLELLVK